MKEITVNTGFGYYTDTMGNVYMKAMLPNGKHFIDDEYTYTEVNNKQELDLINVYVKPKTEKEINKKKIQDKIKDNARKQAIKDLKQEGEIPDDYED